MAEGERREVPIPHAETPSEPHLVPVLLAMVPAVKVHITRRMAFVITCLSVFGVLILLTPHALRLPVALTVAILGYVGHLIAEDSSGEVLQPSAPAVPVKRGRGEGGGDGERLTAICGPRAVEVADRLPTVEVISVT